MLKIKKIMEELMNSVETDLTFQTEVEMDFPEEYGIPTLIFFMKLVKTVQNNVLKSAKISYIFYKKSLAPKKTLIEGSAMRQQLHDATLNSEVIKRLAHTGQDQPQAITNCILGDYDKELESSGYSSMDPEL